MDKTPTSERTSFKGIPPSEPLRELSLSGLAAEEERIVHEIDRLSHSEEIATPIKVPIHFIEGTGYAGTLPTSMEQYLWPGPRGGAFVWLSCGAEEEGGYLQSKQKVKLHRLELQISNKAIDEEGAVALYNCREVQLQRSNPTFGFIKKLFSSPRRTLIHPIGTLSRLETQKRTNLGLLVDFPFGVLGGRDPRPVIWNYLTGKALEFDPKSLKPRDEQNLLQKGSDAVSTEPIYDESGGIYLMIQRTDGVGSDRRHSQYRLIALIPSMPRIATLMAPRSMSLNLLASDATWIVCSAVFSERRLFYLINRQEGRLMAVYQSCVADIRRFIRLKTGSNSIELIALISDGALRRYLFPGIPVQVAKFDGAAGLLTSFPVCEFETVSDGPFDQIHSISNGGFIARQGTLIIKMTEKYSIDQTRDLSPQRLSDFALFPMSREGREVCVAVIGIDPYVGRVTMNLIDGGDMSIIAKIHLGRQESLISIVPPIYIPTRSQ